MPRCNVSMTGFIWRAQRTSVPTSRMPSFLPLASVNFILVESIRYECFFSFADSCSPLFTGVIPPVSSKRPALTPSSTVLVGRGEGKVTVAAGKLVPQQGSSAGQATEHARKRSRIESGGQLVLIDHVIDLTAPELETMQSALPPRPKMGSTPGKEGDPTLADTPISSRLTVEFSAMGPRAEGRTLFGKTASSMWCSTSLMAGENFTNLAHWSDLVEAGHLESIKVGTYYHRAFLAAEREMTLLAQERDNSQTLLAAARKMAADLQDRANKGDKARAELAELEKRLQHRDQEIRALRAKVEAVEAAGLKFKKSQPKEGERHLAPYSADASKITQQAVFDFQRGKGLSIALENTAREFLGKHLGEFLEKCENPLVDGLKLLDSSAAGKTFANAMARDILVKCQDMIVDRNLEVISVHFPQPFDPEEEDFDELFCRAYKRVMEKRQKAKDSAEPSNSKSSASPNEDPPVA